MKKLIILIVLIIIGSLTVFFFYEKSAEEKAYQPVGFGNEYIGEAIEDYVLTQEYFTWKTQENSVNFCSVDNLGSKDDLFPLSVWVYCGEYVLENDNVKITSGFSGPAKIDYPNELSFYDVERFSYQHPKDGASYSENIKEMFSKNVQENILSFDVEEISKITEQKAIDYFNYLKEE
jgi:hypothetical protein